MSHPVPRPCHSHCDWLPSPPLHLQVAFQCTLLWTSEIHVECSKWTPPDRATSLLSVRMDAVTADRSDLSDRADKSAHPPLETHSMVLIPHGQTAHFLRSLRRRFCCCLLGRRRRRRIQWWQQNAEKKIAQVQGSVCVVCSQAGVPRRALPPVLMYGQA